MIFYFSGTGNSLYAAKTLAASSNDELISIADAINSGKQRFEYTLKEDEAIGFIYPIYAWAPPRIVLDFIHKLKLNNYKSNFVYSVATCGENIGNAMKVLDASLGESELKLHSGFSVKMPNNYIIIGDVDSKEVELHKLDEANKALQHISQVIKNRETGVFETNKGFLPFVLTSVINPMFNKNAIDTKRFYSTALCTGCGICEKVCNCKNIKVDTKPQWGAACVQCLACLHYCPVKAIQYGKGTEKKGRYTNTYVKIEDMSHQ